MAAASDDALAGKALYAAGDPGAAAPLLRRALAAHPDDAEIRSCLANALLLQGNAAIHADPRRAERYYREAIYIQPGFCEAMSNLAEALVEQYRLSEALVLFRAALTLRPTDATTGFAYGVALLLSGSLAEGWHHFEARRAMAAWHYDRRRDLPQWVEGMPCAGLRVRATRLRRRHRGSPFRFGLLAAAGATAGQGGAPACAEPCTAPVSD